MGVFSPGGTLEDTDGLRGLGAMGSEPGLWDGSQSSREKAPRGGVGHVVASEAQGDGVWAGVRAPYPGSRPRPIELVSVMA